MTTEALSARLARIIQERQRLLPTVRALVAAWEDIGQKLDDLGDSVSLLTKVAPDELAPLGHQLKSHELNALVSENLRRLRVLEARFGRQSINLGVSGQARVGKSTLLQAISGLDDEQVPTGTGHPVTAVRSQIFHSPKHARGILTLHSFRSFRNEVLAAYHLALGLVDMPSTVEEFARFEYPDDIIDESAQPEAVLSRRGLLKRLRGMQEGLPAYQDELIGDIRQVELSELRQYLAYPTGESATPPGKYLAVRRARIECPFPFAEVENLSLLDLPGLGELAAGAERRHVEGLQNDVDIVLLVMRPQPTSAFVDEKAYKTLDRLHEASEAFSDKEDFVFLVVNDGGVEENLVEALMGDLEERLTGARASARYRLLRANAKSETEVHIKVMEPVLEHLAKRLPIMDREVMQHALERADGHRTILRALDELRATLTELAPETTGVADELDRRTEELRKDISDELTLLLDKLFQAARNEDGDEEFAEAVDQAADEADAWVDDGFGLGEEEWMRDAARTIRLYKGSGRFVADEFNRVRVEISQRFRKLDAFFDKRLAELHASVASILTETVGDRLVAQQDGQSLRAFAERLAESSSETCPELASALLELVNVRLDYQTQLHPRLRRCLDGLVAQYRDPKTGIVKTAITADAEGADELYKRMRQLATQAIHQIKKELHRDAIFPALVIHASAEQFDDAFLRGGHAKQEFKRLTRAYRDDIWPGDFEGIDAHNARVARVKQAIGAVEKAVVALDGLTPR